MKKRITDNEIDLIDSLLIIWKNKSQIILITLISVLLICSITFYKKQTYTATTQIKPISIFDENLYLPYNLIISSIKQDDISSSNFKQIRFNLIDKIYLEDLFIKKVQDYKIILNGIDKFKLIDDKKFKNKDLYFKSIEKLALELKTIPPTDSNDEKKSIKRIYWEIKFKTQDKDKWEKILEYINFEVNNEIKKILINNFKEKKRAINIIKEFELADINNQINNAKEEYATQTKQRLVYLKEQAEIARILDIKNNTLEVQNYNSQISIITDINKSDQYYLHGYKMIEKEIELLNSRIDENIFNEKLLNLNSLKKDLLDNKDLERIEELFLETPIYKSNDFRASDIIYKNTKYNNSINLVYSILIGTIIGLIVGIFNVFFKSAIQNRKK